VSLVRVLAIQGANRDLKTSPCLPMSTVAYSHPYGATNDFVAHLHPYYSYRSSKFDHQCRRVLDFKDGVPAAISHYTSIVDNRIGDKAYIACIPPHAPGRDSSVREMGRRLSQLKRRTDATECLVRHKAITKLSRGGPRHVQVHLTSVRVQNAHLIRGQNVTLIDDVTTTGNSFRACRQLLLDAGATSVRCLAIAKTMR